ncbi:MAG TPA: septal ring lytic transglycosylase RlpA family protein [Thermodesulfobacteriota bacterium]|nr:septal ring lytic transglycosylase RlpA family protein [Thermodesulfobacteriota bacterium]
MKKGAWLLVLGLPLLFSCASITKKGTESYQLDGNTQIGIASWYGNQEHGNKTASGERFSKYDYTAAHKTLPIGTMVRVTNLDNGQDVIVRINDRGPFKKGRIIDLSYAPAKAIGMFGKGTAKVKVEVLSVPREASNYFEAKYTVQVASFADQQNAYNLKGILDDKHKDVRIENVDFGDYTFYRVKIGQFSDKSKAEKIAASLRRTGYIGKVIQE